LAAILKMVQVVGCGGGCGLRDMLESIGRRSVARNGPAPAVADAARKKPRR
jgi:hypothetical protein